MLRPFAMSATLRVQVDLGNLWGLNVVMMKVQFFFVSRTSYMLSP